MRSIELLYIYFLATRLCHLAFGFVLVQRLTLRATQWPAALVAGDVIAGLDAVQAAHANGCRDLCRSTHQGRLLQDNLIGLDVTCGHQVATQQLVVRYLQIVPIFLRLEFVYSWQWK